MNLTDKQAEIMAICCACQTTLEPAVVKDALESEKVEPMQMVCARCAASPDNITAAFVSAGIESAAHALYDRVGRAGLKDHYQAEANEWSMRQQHEQN